MSKKFQAGVAKVLAFVCDRDSRVESVSAEQGISPLLGQDRRLLESLTVAASSGPLPLADRWSDLVETGSGFQAEVLVQLREGEKPESMVLHAMPLRETQAYPCSW
ncbi:MAG UNVERIFIED_CONTAM: hypothetical protein LVR18_11170 [Planctomycetaceae bacterium]|jgi:hypothetical protein